MANLMYAIECAEIRGIGELVGEERQKQSDLNRELFARIAASAKKAKISLRGHRTPEAAAINALKLNAVDPELKLTITRYGFMGLNL